jgi:5-formyltetrahydrofolate cyclo-ligase
MIFDSLGFGELGVIVVVAVLFLDPSKLASAARAIGRLRRKWSALQRDVKEQFDALALEENLRDSADAVRKAKAALRAEALTAVRALTAHERAEAAESALAQLSEWQAWRNAKVVALFCGKSDEIDSEGIVRAALAAGKTVLLPRVADEAAGRPRMEMVPVRDYDRDLREGAFGILEPERELTAEGAPEPELILIPGAAFDERGGRVGRGKGFYDRYLEGRTALRAGLAYEAQVVRKKLPLEAHDQLLDALVTERRRLDFSQPQTTQNGVQGGPQSGSGG